MLFLFSRLEGAIAEVSPIDYACPLKVTLFEDIEHWDNWGKLHFSGAKMVICALLLSAQQSVNLSQ